MLLDKPYNTLSPINLLYELLEQYQDIKGSQHEN